MGFKTFTSTTLTAADVNDYLMEQVVIVCTSATRPTAQEGMVVYETDTDKLSVYNGAAWLPVWQGAWTSYTPTLTNVTTTSGTLVAYYAQFGKTVHFSVKFTLGGSSAISGLIGVDLPVTAARTESGLLVAHILDSGTAYHPAVPLWGSTSRIDITVPNTAGTYAVTANTSSTVPMTWTTSDYFTLSGTYEAA